MTGTIHVSQQAAVTYDADLFRSFIYNGFQRPVQSCLASSPAARNQPQTFRKRRRALYFQLSHSQGCLRSLPSIMRSARTSIEPCGSQSTSIDIIWAPWKSGYRTLVKSLTFSWISNFMCMTVKSRLRCVGFSHDASQRSSPYAAFCRLSMLHEKNP